jgi:hypothetical protein
LALTEETQTGWLARLGALVMPHVVIGPLPSQLFFPNCRLIFTCIFISTGFMPHIAG